ncbi:hypothetical protein GQ54DRAFT_337570 [Martensiomyces pterosporus]|nr:hypothetical protein GQ54DRAFT_337570 [Martensiomyces pterosporus]
MPEERARNPETVVGYLQKRSRFYGWTRRLFLLSPRGLAMLPNERGHRVPKGQTNTTQPHTRVIGESSGINASHAVLLKHKLLIEIPQISHVASQGERDFVVTASTTGPLTLRAPSAQDRDLWLRSIESAVAAHTTSARDTKPTHSSRDAVGINTTRSKRPATANPYGRPQAPATSTPFDGAYSHDATRINASEANMLKRSPHLDKHDSDDDDSDNNVSMNPQTQHVVMAWRRAVLEALSQDDSIASSTFDPNRIFGQPASSSEANENDPLGADVNRTSNPPGDVAGDGSKGMPWLPSTAQMVHLLPTRSAEYDSNIEAQRRPVKIEIARAGSTATRMSSTAKLETAKPQNPSTSAGHGSSAGEHPKQPVCFLSSTAMLSLDTFDVAIDTDNFDVDLFFEGDRNGTSFSDSSQARTAGGCTSIAPPYDPHAGSDSLADETPTSTPLLVSSGAVPSNPVPAYAAKNSNDGASDCRHRHDTRMTTSIHPPALSIPAFDTGTQSNSSSRGFDSIFQAITEPSVGLSHSRRYPAPPPLDPLAPVPTPFSPSPHSCTANAVSHATKPQQGVQGSSCTRDYVCAARGSTSEASAGGTAPAAKAPKLPDKSALVDIQVSTLANSSIYDIGLADWPTFLGNTSILPISTANESTSFTPQNVASASPSGQADIKLQGALAAQQDSQVGEWKTHKSAVSLLDSPEQQRVGGHSPGVFKSIAAITRLSTSRQTLPAGRPGTAGIQPSLLSKYSDSLNTSRSRMASAGRAGRPKTMHEWRMLSRNLREGRNADKPPDVVEYTPVEPGDTGVNRVVKGQLAKDIIQKENTQGHKERRSGVRRMRRVKSESKVVQLKSIRLKLDGAIVGSRALLGRPNDASVHELGHKDHSTNGSRNMERASLNHSQIRNPAGDTAGPGHNEQAAERSVDVLAEFSEIQSRLKLAEEQKKREQYERILSKEGVDDVRIADILETKQDVPLAVQLQEKRQVHLAKQQVLLKQQIEQQKQQIELQKQHMEQQRQHQQFMQQSLRPVRKAASQFSLRSGASSACQNVWQGQDSRSMHGGNRDAYTSQWVQHQSVYGENVPLSHTVGSYPQMALQPPPAQQPAMMMPHGMHPAHQIQHMAGRVPAPQYPSQPKHTPSTPDTASSEPGAAWPREHGLARSFSHQTGASAPSSQSIDNSRRTLNRNPSANTRRQAGAAFFKSAGPAPHQSSPHSSITSDSWQSHVDHRITASMHASTELPYEGSVYTTSPVLSAVTARRTSSFGPFESKRPAHSTSETQMLRQKILSAAEEAPPVPALPPAIAAMKAANSGSYAHHGYPYPPPPPAPLLSTHVQQPPLSAHHHPHQMHPQAYGQWAPPSQTWNGQLMHQQSPQPAYGASPSYPMAHQSYPQKPSSGVRPRKRMHGGYCMTETEKMEKKRNEMAAETPSLLQRLDMARVTGVLPIRQTEKAPYTLGAYQNLNGVRLYGDSAATPLLGNSPTLLIDRLHESEVSRTAFLKKISRSYTGIGGEVAPQKIVF